MIMGPGVQVMELPTSAGHPHHKVDAADSKATVGESDMERNRAITAAFTRKD
jgi:hypothetical protein